MFTASDGHTCCLIYIYCIDLGQPKSIARGPGYSEPDKLYCLANSEW